MESAAVAVYVSIAAVIGALALRRLVAYACTDTFVKTPLIPASFGTYASALLALGGVANLALQGTAVAIGETSEVAHALLAVYNLFSVLWILATDKDAAAVTVGVGAIFSFAALVVQVMFKRLTLGSYLLMAVAALTATDFGIYVVYVPCVQSTRQTELDANMNQVENLRGQLLELQVKIKDIEDNSDPRNT